MGQVFKAIISGLILALLAGLAHAQDIYRIRSGDTLSIEVLEDGSLNRAVQVLPDGRINFPFAGSLAVAGLTAQQIELSIVRAISSNFTNPPTVFVGVRPAPIVPQAPVATGVPTIPTIDIYFVGEVNRPGLVSVKPGTTLLQAVAVSGGLSRFAATKRIQLRRTGADGVSRVSTLNYKALASGAAANDIKLMDGDVILVPERRLFE